MKDYYAARAAEYDRIYAKPERQADLRRIERWLPGVLEGRCVLEIACGTGYWTQFIAPRCPRVVAFDAAPETVEIARSRPANRSVEFVIADVYELPARSEPLEAAFAGFWWSHIPLSRIAGFLAGLHAALVPGAPVVFLDNRYVTGSSTPIADRDSEGNTFQTRRLADGSSHRVLKNFPSRQEIFAAVRDLASDVRYHEWQHYWALEYRTLSR